MARTIGSDGEKTQAAIHVAARRLIAKVGYEAMSMRQLAEKVGVQAAALYRYHPTKQELLFAVMRDHMDRLLAAWQTESQTLTTPFERLAAFIRFHIRYHVERRDDVHIANMELRSLQGEKLAILVELRAVYENELRLILEAGSASGQFDIDDIPLTTRAIIAMTTGVNVWFRPDDRLTVTQIAEKYVTMGLRLVGAKNVTTKDMGE